MFPPLRVSELGLRLHREMPVTHEHPYTMGARGGDDQWLPRRLRADPDRHRLGTAAPVADRRIDVRSKTALAEVLAVEILEHALPFGGRQFGRQAGDPVQEIPSDSLIR